MNRRPTLAASTAPRPHRISILLAAAWLIVAMAIGGLSLESTAAQAAAPATTTTGAQP